MTDNKWTIVVLEGRSSSEEELPQQLEQPAGKSRYNLRPTVVQ
jgi:hypothetical protein